jgi:hypothetical protein
MEQEIKLKMKSGGDLAICSPSMETARSVGKHIYKLKTKLFFLNTRPERNGTESLYTSKALSLKKSALLCNLYK